MTATSLPAPAVDAHCHIDLYPSPADIVARAEAADVQTIAVTNAPAVFAHTQALAAGHAHIRAALGLHPELVRTHGHQLDRFLALLPATRYVGEIGLDFTTTDQEERLRQQRVFDVILRECADARDKVLTVHSRRASRPVIDAIGDGFPGTAILHWFSGSLKDLDRAAAAGMYFSVNPAMAKSATGRKLIAAMPPDRVLTETDGPFVKTSDRPTIPPDVATIAPLLGEFWDCAPQEAMARVYGNFTRAVGTF